MLDLFKRSSSTHVRSGSTSHLRDAPSSSFSPSNASQELCEDHWGTSLLESPRPDPLNPNILTPPTLTHQYDPTKPRRPAVKLPPLLTRPEVSKLGAAHLDHQTQLQLFAYTPEPSPQQSPTTKFTRESTHALTGDKLERIKKESQNRVLSGWFNGQSEPINISIVPSPTKDIPDPLPDMSANPAQTHKPTLSSRFSFFGGKASPAKPTISPTDPTDEFLDLDITTSLYPSGPADSFSPASFKNHMQHAEGLLARLHAAYKERTTALLDMTAEKETQAEEMEGAETRSKHLKIQLNDMSSKLAEQDKAMMELVDELANEKRLRRDEEDARKKSIKLVKPSGIGLPTQCLPERPYETDCDSEDESSAESLFSRPHSSSARMSLSSVSTTSSPESYQPPDLTGIATAQSARLRHAQPTVIKPQRQPSTGGESPAWSCANCQGASSSEAWNIVHMLKDENGGLKDRVNHMEAALDGCLDVINSL